MEAESEPARSGEEEERRRGRLSRATDWEKSRERVNVQDGEESLVALGLRSLQHSVMNGASRARRGNALSAS